VPTVRRRSAPATKAAILEAARRHFGADGYERTTLRSIAAEVGVDAAMVVRYFGTKERLFAASAEFDLRLPDLSDVSPDQLAAVLLPHFFRVWERETTFLALLRAAVTSQEAAATMRSVFAQQVAPVLQDVTPDHRGERAALFGSQMLGLAVSRYVLQTPPLAAMSHEELIRWVGPVMQYYLTEPH
jgi:AcrR family transcriptional regulator